MYRLLIVCTLVAALSSPAASEDSPQFTDTVCPNATPVGRHLNELANSATVLTSDLMQTAQQLVTVYQECAADYDRNAAAPPSAAPAGQSSQLSRRLYAHLALARAQQRVGNYDAHQQQYGDARASYDAALSSLAALNAIGVASAAPDATERMLLAKGASFKQEIEAAEAALPKSAASPAKSPSPAPSLPGTLAPPATGAPQHS